MNHLLSIAFFLLSISLAAQDSTKLRVFYAATYKNYYEEELQEDYQVLCIGKTLSKYYSEQQRLFQAYLDSVLPKNHTSDETIAVILDPKTPPRGVGYKIYKNYPAVGAMTCAERIPSFYFIYEESLPELDWQMEEGDTIIATYPCHKATTEYHGRNWTAWYSLDLPFDDGPWKLRGLPGLILQASESEGIFSFTCKAISSSEHKPIIFAETNYEHTTPKQFEKDLISFWNDQEGFVLRRDGFGFLAKSSSSPRFKACLIEVHP